MHTQGQAQLVACLASRVLKAVCPVGFWQQSVQQGFWQQSGLGVGRFDLSFLGRPCYQQHRRSVLKLVVPSEQCIALAWGIVMEWASCTIVNRCLSVHIGCRRPFEWGLGGGRTLPDAVLQPWLHGLCSVESDPMQ